MENNTFQELEVLLPPVLKSKLVPFIQGKPGVGKSSLWRKIAEQKNLKFIDIRLSTFDPTMFNGFLWMDDESKRASFMSLDLFPLEGDEIPINPDTITDDCPDGIKYAGYLVHLDEFTQAPKSVEGAAFQLVLDRMVGDKPLHKSCYVVCSGNPVGMGNIAKSISSPMRTRLIHFQLENTLASFTPAMIDLDFHPAVVSFLNAEEDYLNNFEDHWKNKDGAYACERSWESLSKLMKAITAKGKKVTNKHLPILTGTVGEVAGQMFFVFLESYYSCPDISDIAADPHAVLLPTGMAEKYACIAYLVDKATINNGANLAIFMQKFPEEFQFIFGRFLLNKNEKVFDAHFKFLTKLVVEYAI